MRVARSSERPVLSDAVAALKMPPTIWGGAGGEAPRHRDFAINGMEVAAPFLVGRPLVQAMVARTE
jgi:hypothetical protein